MAVAPNINGTSGALECASGVEFLSLTLPIFHEHFLQTSGFFAKNEEKSAPPP
jgi:hypothetical protein